MCVFRAGIIMYRFDFLWILWLMVILLSSIQDVRGSKYDSIWHQTMM